MTTHASARGRRARCTSIDDPARRSGKRDTRRRLAALLLAVQFWTLKAGFVSIAMAAFMLLSLTNMSWRAIPKTVYVLAVAALISYALSQPPRAATGFHYSFWFSLSTLLILGAWVNWTLMLRRYQPGRDLSTPLLISILVCIVSIAVLSPLALVEPVDDPWGSSTRKDWPVTTLQVFPVSTSRCDAMRSVGLYSRCLQSSVWWCSNRDEAFCSMLLPDARVGGLFHFAGESPPWW